MQKITTFLTFNDQAEEAVKFYISTFPNSKIVSTSRYGEAGPGPKGQLMTATFKLAGQNFMALNGGPTFKFALGISLFVNCETQEEVDEFWEKLSEGEQKNQCGWLTDKFGVSWQIVPSILGKLLYDKDPRKSKRGHAGDASDEETRHPGPEASGQGKVSPRFARSRLIGRSSGRIAPRRATARRASESSPAAWDL